MTEKFCTKCGKKFMTIGRQVICPDCKAAAEEDAKRTAVMKAKRASWNGESVPVRISGRASTIIRRYGAANNLPFMVALDALLQASTFFQSVGKAWEEVEPYKSHRRDKHATEAQDAQTAQDGAQAAGKPQEVKQEVKQDKPVKPIKTAAKKAVKTVTGKTNKGGKA